jgi:hypothetical protein
MDEEETRETMIKVGSHAAMVASVAIGGCCEGFDHDPDQVEDLLIEGLIILLEEIESEPSQAESRDQLLAALRRRKEAIDG